MTIGSPWRWRSLAPLCALGLMYSVGLALATDERPRRDDSCTTQCDNDSDKCSRAAGSDKDKQKACDTVYEECLRKCG